MPRAVLAGRDLALERRVRERMVLDVHGEPLLARLERDALRHGPARERAVPLEAEVVVEPPRVVALDDEDRRAVASAAVRAERLGRRLRVPFAAVLLERHARSLPARAVRGEMFHDAGRGTSICPGRVPELRARRLFRPVGGRVRGRPNADLEPFRPVSIAVRGGGEPCGDCGNPVVPSGDAGSDRPPRRRRRASGTARAGGGAGRRRASRSAPRERRRAPRRAAARPRRGRRARRPRAPGRSRR